MKGLRLIATGGALPGRTVTNEELSRTVDTSDEWITTRTGIRTRHYCTEGENAATLAIAAAKQALQRSGLAPADIACCVCATLSAPDATPSVACQVQAALSAQREAVFADVSRFMPEAEVLDVFRLKYDYHNIKTLLKAPQDAERLLIDAGTVPAETMRTPENTLPPSAMGSET